MKKILFAIPSLDSGGAERLLVDFVKNIDKSMYDVYVFSIYAGGLYTEEIKKNSHYYHAVSISDKDTLWNKIFNRIKRALVRHLPADLFYRIFIGRERFDVEVSFLEGWTTKFISASNNVNSKKVAWIHTDMIKNPHADFAFRSLQKQEKCYQKYDKIICVSEQTKKQFEKKFENNKYLADVIHNPIDLSSIRQKSQEKISDCWNEDSFNIVVVGRLVKVKGQERLIHVLKEKIFENINFCLHIIGEGEERKRLEREAHTLINTGKCRFWGLQKNPYKFIAKSDLCICPSYAEGFPISIIEVLALHKIMLATECAGVREVLEDGKYGYICENSSEGLKQGIMEIYNNYEKFCLKYDAVDNYIERYDIKNMMQKIERNVF